MSRMDRLHAVEVLSAEILRSPYVFKDLPDELHRLRTVMRNMELLLREELPWLVNEVKRLRSENKRLLAATMPELASDTEAPAADGTPLVGGAPVAGGNGVEH